MATTKLALPTITGNMTADVVRDLNALAEAVDAKAGVASGLATLGADGKVPASQLNVSSDAATLNGKTAIQTPATIEQTDLVGMINEAFTSASNGKTSIANAAGSPSLPSDTFTKIANDITTGKAKMASAIRSKGGSANDADAWETMAQAVEGIVIPKKASGTVTSDASSMVTVSGLNFIPSKVTIFIANSPTTAPTLYSKKLSATNYNCRGTISRTIDYNGGYVTMGGFKLEFSLTSSTVTWEAEE